MMFYRDRTPPNDGEMDCRDPPTNPRRGRPGGNGSDYDRSPPEHDGGEIGYGDELFPNGFSSRPPSRVSDTEPPRPEGPHSRHLSFYEPATDGRPEEEEGGPPGYASSHKPTRSTNRFLDDRSADFDDPLPAKSNPIRALGFFLLMATIGSSAGALWFYDGPDLTGYASSFSSTKVDTTIETLNRLADEQTKLTQAVAALQAAQDVLQKSMVAGEQERQRLSAETQALRTDVNAVRASLADFALRSKMGQATKSAPAPAKKTKVERKSAPPHDGPQGAPVALSPPPQ